MKRFVFSLAISAGLTLFGTSAFAAAAGHGGGGYHGGGGHHGGGGYHGPVHTGGHGGHGGHIGPVHPGPVHPGPIYSGGHHHGGHGGHVGPVHPGPVHPGPVHPGPVHPGGGHVHPGPVHHPGHGWHNHVPPTHYHKYGGYYYGGRYYGRNFCAHGSYRPTYYFFFWGRSCWFVPSTGVFLNVAPAPCDVITIVIDENGIEYLYNAVWVPGLRCYRFTDCHGQVRDYCP